jgi:cytochrome c oxidase assembly factor CtaG
VQLLPLVGTRFLTAWRLDVPATVLLIGAVTAYVVGVGAAARRGVRWLWWRTAAFLLGVGCAAVCTMSSLAVYDRVLLWPLAVQLTALLTVVPLGLALGDPVGLAAAARPLAGGRRPHRLPGRWLLRVLGFPAVAGLLAMAAQFAVFFTGYLTAALRHPAVMDLLYLQTVVTGCLFAVPLLSADLLPAWCTQPLRLTFALIDGLVDAFPGIAVMTTGPLLAGGWYGRVQRSWGPAPAWDQTIAGALMLTLSEVVALPMVVLLLRAWIREDAVHAARIDRELDEGVPDPDVPLGERTRPWWEVDPGPLAGRAERHGWTRGEPPD